ncbi:hypothetical protein T4E_4952 [Trichinella pseudospiralis]|uniref:Uncharacterized protein n=1 Tax=Trichinella pseudospiralis TaxID=6337 RepID=A0A0V0Y451_TRIPS|nr:hypothetical protein T4E_4952 [Trichinella pseudospiralis]
MLQIPTEDKTGASIIDIRELVDFQSNKALAFFSRLFFWSHIRKTGRNTEENVTGISRDCR